MAKFTGSLLVMIIGSKTVTASDIIDIDYEWTNDSVENHGVGDAYKTNLTTVSGFTFTVNGYDDSPGTVTTNSLRDALVTVQAQADHQDVFEIRPFGSTAGKRKITGTAHLDSMSGGLGSVANALLSGKFTATGTVTDTTQ